MPYIGNPIYQSAFVTDQFSGDGSTTAFTMSVAPAGVSNVLVAVSGVLQDPSTYGVVGNTLTFTAAPPSGTGNISCRYLGVPVTGVVTTAYRTVTEFTATASQTTFTPPSYTVGFINVYLNGVLLASTDYTATNGTTVVLTTGASAGNILTVESFRVESVANAIPNAAGAVSSSNLASGIVTPDKLSTGAPVWDSSYNLGVGYSNPSAFATGLDLVVGSGATSAGVSVFTSTSEAGGIYFADGATSSDRYRGYVEYTHSNDGLALGTAATTRLNINSSGYVTMPYQVAFHVRVNNANFITTSPVPFSNAVYNIGNAWNTSTYTFTAPIAGKYVFMLVGYARLTSSTGGFNFQLMVNGSQRQYSDITPGVSGTTYWTVPLTTILNLSVGDTVSYNAGISSSSYYGGNSEMNLFGYLLG